MVQYCQDKYRANISLFGRVSSHDPNSLRSEVTECRYSQICYIVGMQGRVYWTEIQSVNQKLFVGLWRYCFVDLITPLLLIGTFS